MKAILIGRHTPDLGSEDIEVAECRAVTFPTTSAECQPVLKSLIEEARAQRAVLLLQNTPGQVAAALVELAFASGVETGWAWRAETRAGQEDDNADPYYMRVGIVISVPGPRPGKVSESWEFISYDLDDAGEAVRFANPRAMTYINMPSPEVPESFGTLTVEVDGPPMPFAFSHIEWLRGYW